MHSFIFSLILRELGMQWFNKLSHESLPFKSTYVHYVLKYFFQIKTFIYWNAFYTICRIQMLVIFVSCWLCPLLQSPVWTPGGRQCCSLFQGSHSIATLFCPLSPALQQHGDKIGSNFSCFTVFLFVLSVESKWKVKSDKRQWESWEQ